MGDKNIFVSVGGVFTDEQDEFVRAVEDQLRAEGLIPQTLGRNFFSADAPLQTISKLMDSCVGTVVIALERTYFPSGLERRNGRKERPLTDVKLATPWNQVEAALAYSRDQPLLVIVEEGLRTEGLLEPGYDWYVQKVPLDPASLRTPEFVGILRSWSQKLPNQILKPKKAFDPGQLSIGDLVYNLKVGQFWGVLGASAALIAGAFALGLWFGKAGVPASAASTQKQPQAVQQEITKMVCTGEFEAKCAAPHDVFFGCKPPTNDAIAADVCADLHRSTSRFLEVSKNGGNNCGYSMLKVTCF